MRDKLLEKKGTRTFCKRTAKQRLERNVLEKTGMWQVNKDIRDAARRKIKAGKNATATATHSDNNDEHMQRAQSIRFSHTRNQYVYHCTYRILFQWYTGVNLTNVVN